jgi:hypothetical protein
MKRFTLLTFDEFPRLSTDIRVTRLAEFSLIRRLFSLGSCFNYRSSFLPILATFLPREKWRCIHFYKKGVGRFFWKLVWGRCYDHNFLRFSTIFGKKIGVFLKNQCHGENFAQISFVLRPKRQFFGENILKIQTSTPGHTGLHRERIDNSFHCCKSPITAGFEYQAASSTTTSRKFSPSHLNKKNNRILKRSL